MSLLPQVNSSAALRVGEWYLIAIPQNAPDYETVTRSRRRSLLGQDGLAQRLAGLYSDPHLRSVALAAAEAEGLLPPGTAAALLPAAVSVAGARAQPVTLFVQAAVKYAVLQSAAEWAQEGGGGGAAPAQGGASAANAAPGTITSYLCELPPGCGAVGGQLLAGRHRCLLLARPAA